MSLLEFFRNEVVLLKEGGKINDENIVELAKPVIKKYKDAHLMPNTENVNLEINIPNQLDHPFLKKKVLIE
jgi:hypothetical protein